MGKRRRRNREKNAEKHRQYPPWVDIEKKNELLEFYYKAQQIVADEEWDTFINYCRKDLPSTFRITKIRGHSNDLLRCLKEGYIAKIDKEEIKKTDQGTSNNGNDNEETEQDLYLEPISWYPDELAWNSNLSRRFIRRSTVLEKLHRFLVEDSECGAITRQEAVSMIPPLFLDVKSDHLVLDLCAAPGSKTAQIIEMMHADKKQDIPKGAVIANDADHKRCYMLTHQAKRLNTPCVIITNHDASIFPKLYDSKIPGIGKPILFDRVLCDVPCSGDGTIRKNPNMWHKWHPHLGVGLHRLQARILTRGLELLKVGGRLVYSTCSFNPIENEAVLANVLSQVEGSVHIVDCNEMLPGLLRKPGMTHWKVFDRKNNEFKNIDEVTCSPTEGYKKSMFPPSTEFAEKLKLKNAMRVYPHLQNTGGFFIAVLEKADDLPWQKAKRERNMKYLPWEEAVIRQKIANRLNNKGLNFKEETETETIENGAETNNIQEISKSNKTGEKSSDFCKTEISENEGEVENIQETSESNDAGTKSPDAKKFRRGMIKEDPFCFLDDTDKDLQDIRKFYNVSLELPSNQFLIRTAAGKKNHIYLVSESVHNVMSSNSNLKVINTGVRAVTRSSFRAGSSEHGMEYRLVQEGLDLLHGFIKNRVINITLNDMIVLISNSETNIELLYEGTRENLSKIEMGCVIWHYNPVDTEKLTADIWLCGHTGREIVQCMLTKEERKHFLRILDAPIPEDLQLKVKGKDWGDGKTRKAEEKNSGKPEKDFNLEKESEKECAEELNPEN